MTIIEQATRRKHACSPPKYRPKDEWRTVPPPLAFIRPTDRERAQPCAVPTQYPVGTLWCCSCGRVWRNVEKPPPRYGYSPRGSHWVPVQWWQFKIRHAIEAHKIQADYRHAAAIVATWEPSP